MKKRSKLRKRVREWLNRKKEQKEEKAIPSFGDSLLNLQQEQLKKTTDFFQNKKTTGNN